MDKTSMSEDDTECTDTSNNYKAKNANTEICI